MDMKHRLRSPFAGGIDITLGQFVSMSALVRCYPFGNKVNIIKILREWRECIACDDFFIIYSSAIGDYFAFFIIYNLSVQLPSVCERQIEKQKSGMNPSFCFSIWRLVQYVKM